MAVDSTEALRGVLFEAYDGFADKRLKDLSRDAPFVVDDRAARDHDAQGHLFLWFCQMLVHIDAADRARLILRGGMPEGPTISDWFQAHGVQRTNFGHEIKLTPANIAELSDLALAFAAVTRKPYEVKAYKFVVPRV